MCLKKLRDTLGGELEQFRFHSVSNLKIDKVIVWGGADGEGGISSLLKDLITGLPPVTELARAVGVELPPVLGKVASSVSTDGVPVATTATFTHPAVPNGQPGTPEART